MVSYTLQPLWFRCNSGAHLIRGWVGPRMLPVLTWYEAGWAPEFFRCPLDTRLGGPQNFSGAHLIRGWVGPRILPVPTWYEAGWAPEFCRCPLDTRLGGLQNFAGAHLIRGWVGPRILPVPTWYEAGWTPEFCRCPLDTRLGGTQNFAGAHLIRDWVDPRTSLDILKKRKISSPDGEPSHETLVAHTEVVLKIQIFRDVAPYRLVNSYRRFEGSLFSNLYGAMSTKDQYPVVLLCVVQKLLLRRMMGWWRHYLR